MLVKIPHLAIKPLVDEYKQELPDLSHVEVLNHIANICGYKTFNDIKKISKTEEMLSINTNDFDFLNKLVSKIGNYIIIENEKDLKFAVVTTLISGFKIDCYSKKTHLFSFENPSPQTTITSAQKDLQVVIDNAPDFWIKELSKTLIKKDISSRKSKVINLINSRKDPSFNLFDYGNVKTYDLSEVNKDNLSNPTKDFDLIFSDIICDALFEKLDCVLIDNAEIFQDLHFEFSKLHDELSSLNTDIVLFSKTPLEIYNTEIISSDFDSEKIIMVSNKISFSDGFIHHKNFSLESIMKTIPDTLLIDSKIARVNKEELEFLKNKGIKVIRI